MANIIQIKRKTTAGAPALAQLAIGELCIVVPDNTLYFKKDNSTIVGPITVGGGSLSPITGTATFNFADENDTVVTTIANTSITFNLLKTVTFIPWETTETSLDDFNLNDVTFNIENIIDNVSFDIRANAHENASGIYTMKYIINI
jgi:hypothetical protein